MTPTTMHLGVKRAENIWVDSVEEWLKVRNRIMLNGTLVTHPHASSYYHGDLVLWNGHEFEVAKFRLGIGSTGMRIYPSLAQGTEQSMFMYYPIDPRIIKSDVLRATHAYPNETNDGWLFSHTDEGSHHDYELQLLAATDGVFQPFFRQLQVDSFSDTETARTRAQARFKLLAEFYGAVIVEARRLARMAFLGEREQQTHPREGWLDRNITSAVETIKGKWTTSRATDLAELSSALSYVTRSLAMPAVETRWERAARLEAEAEAAKETESEGQ